MSIAPSKHSVNVAARMAHWSSRHRKTAIWGWLTFVVVVFMVGNNVFGATQISDIDQLSGEAHEAEVALDGAGLRPVEEVVFIRSDKLTVEDPEFQAAVTDVTSRLSKVPYVENVKSPLTGDSEVSADGRAALVGFEIRGDSTRGQGACRSRPRRGRRRPGRASEPGGRAVRQRQRQQGRQRDHHRGPQEGGGALPADHADHPDHHVRLAGGGGAAAADGDHGGIAALGVVAIPSGFLPLDGNLSAVILLIGLAVGVDYSLFYLRREREERAAGRSERAALEAAAATSGRAVLISGVTVIVAMAGMFISGDKAFISFAEGAIVVVAMAMFASLTVLPAMLAWLGDRVEKGRIPLLGRRRPAGSRASGRPSRAA